MSFRRWRACWTVALCCAALSGAARAQEAYGGAVANPDAKAPAAPVLTRPPELLEAVDPVYPEQARAQRLSADVTLRVEIAEDGSVRSAEVTRPAGNGFDEAAVAAVKQFRFSPAEIDHAPSPVQIEYTLHFVFTEPPPPEPSPTDAPKLPPVTVTGKVLQRGNRKPVAGATVQASPSEEAVTTGPDGAFELRLPPGAVRLKVLDPDHQPFDTAEVVREGERLEVTYYVMPRLIGLNETVVRGNRERKEVTRRTLAREELEKVPGSFGDPVRVLQNLPGLARVAFGGGQLIVRGASPNDTGTYLDGVQIPLLYHFGGGPSVVNPAFVDRIDFYPGGFGSEYGRAIGGIVDVATRSPRDDAWHGSASVDLIHSGAYLSVPLTKGLTVSAAGRRSYIDLFLPLVLRGSSAVVSPFYYDYQARLDWRPEGSRHALQLFGFGSNDFLRVVVGRGGSSDLQLNNRQWFQRLVLGWSWRGDALAHRAQLFVGRNGASVGVGTAQRNQDDDVMGLRERLEWKVGPLLTLRGGLDAQLTWSTVSTFVPPAQGDYRGFPGERPDAPPEAVVLNHDAFPYAEWLEAQLSLGGLKLIPGLRAEQYRVSGQWRTAFDPRLTVRQELGPTVLKGSVGLYHSAPGPGQLETDRGNPDLALEAAFQAALGVEHRFTDTLNVDVTGFYNRRFDLVQRTGRVVVEADGTPRRLNFDNIGLGRAYGVEVFLRHELTANFFGWVAYTLAWSEVRNEGNEGYRWANFDQRHILTLLGQYKFGNGWELGGRFRLVSGNPTTPYLGSTFDADNLSYSPISGEFGSARLPTFHQLDVRVDKTWLFDLWTLGLYLDVQNVYNQANQEAVQNDYRYKTQLPITGLPILPTLGVKGTF